MPGSASNSKSSSFARCARAKARVRREPTSIALFRSLGGSLPALGDLLLVDAEFGSGPAIEARGMLSDRVQPVPLDVLKHLGHGRHHRCILLRRWGIHGGALHELKL